MMSLRRALGLATFVGGLALAESASAAPPAGDPPANDERRGAIEAAPHSSPSTHPKPPRISGTFLGMAIWPALGWVRSPNLDVDQRPPLAGGGGAVRVGQAVFPWLTLGVDAGGAFMWDRNRFFMKGGLMIDAGFYPVPRHPFSIHTGVGFGAGLVLDDRVQDKGGVGGPRFSGALRYEFFPGADRRRPRKPGGWALGPELAWRGFTPSAKGRAMSNVIVLGLWFGFYWGR